MSPSTPSPAAARLTRHPAAFSPAEPPRALCPRCWSRLDVNWGKGRDVGTREMRGWSVGRAERLVLGDAAHSVTVAVHRCANAACPTAVEVTTLLAGGWVPELVARRQLRGDDARRFAEGRHDAGGVWRDRRGEPRTAPEQRELFG